MNDRDLAAAVADERERTVARIAALTRQFEQIVESNAIAPPDDEHDPEGATVAFERAQVSALLDQARQTLTALDEASARLARGGYGTCERCGAAIPAERLLARPTARTCVSCAGASQRRR